MKKSTFYYTLLLVISGYTLLGQSPKATDFKKVEPNYTVSKIDLGISDKQVGLRYAIKDSTGYLWLTSKRGLNVTNGEEALRYANGAERFTLLKDSINSHISYMCKDSDENFILTFVDENIVMRYNPYTREVIDTVYVANKPPTTDLQAEDAHDGSLVYITGDGVLSPICLYKVTKKGDKSLLFKFPEQEGELEIVSSLVSIQNQYLIFTSKYIYCLNESGEVLKKIPIKENAERLRFSYKVNGKVYFANYFTQEVYYWDSQTLSLQLFFKVPDKTTLPARFFLTDERYLLLSNEQHIWVYDLQDKTYQDLMPIYREYIATYTNHKTPPSLVSGIIEENGNILLNGENNLFRFSMYQKDIFKYQEIVDGLKLQPSMRQITEGEDGTLYACYYVGMAKKNKTDNLFYPIDIPQKPKKRISTYSLSLYEDSFIWDNQLIDLESNYYDLTSQANTLAHTAQYRRGDSLWSYAWWTEIFSFYDLKNRKITEYPFNNENFVNVDVEMISEIIPDNENKHLWIATLKNGICLLSKKGKILKQYTPERLGMPPKAAVYDLLVEGDIIWYAGDAGLGSINMATGQVNFKQFQNTSNQEELLNRQIYFIEPLNTNQFYLGTDRGILLFNKQDRKYLALDNNHPLEDLEFNRASHFKSSEGKYYMGTTSGLFSFYPEQLTWKEGARKVPVRIDEVAIFSNEGKHRFLSAGVNKLNEVTIQPTDASIEILCSSVKDTEDIFYSYRIEGLTDNWSTYTSENRISLLGLPAGNFNLEIRNNVAPELVNTIRLNKTEFWHKRWYIQLAIISVFGLLAFGFIRYRYQQRLTKEKEMIGLRNKISSDLHDDVGSLLTAVSMQSEVLARKAPPAQSEKLNKIGSLSREAMGRMRDNVWYIDSRKDTIGSLADRMNDYLVDILDENEQFIYSFKQHIDKSEASISPLVRQNIYLLFKEAITNALKHSNGNKIHIVLEQAKNSISLMVEDNGTKNENIKVSGLGLTNMELRAKRVAGALTIDTTKNFIISLKVPT